MTAFILAFLLAMRVAVPLFTAGMEAGDLAEWEAGATPPSTCGGQFNSGDGVTVPSQDYAHTGLWSAKMTITGDYVTGSANGTRMHRWCEPQQYPTLFYSVWYRIPQLTIDPQDGWINIFQFKSIVKAPFPPANDPFFYLDIFNAPTTGAMRLKLVWWRGLTIEGPAAGQFGYRTWNSTKDIPANQWFRIQVRYICKGDFTGSIRVWQDGVQVFNLPNVRTRYPDGTCAWGVNNYGTAIAPSPVVLYIDDAAISQTKMP